MAGILTFLKSERARSERLAKKEECKLDNTLIYIDWQGALCVKIMGTDYILTESDEDIIKLADYFKNLINYNIVER